MKKHVPSHLLQYFLYQSPKQVAERMAKLVPCMAVDHQNYPSDPHYADSFLFRLNCQYLHSQELIYTHKESKLLNQLVSHQLLHRQSGRKPQKTKIQQQLIQIIKALNLEKGTPTIFLEAEEVVLRMSAEEAHRYKKYLVYLYKWIINSNGKIPSPTQELHAHLKKIVVEKIYEGNQKKQSVHQIQEELKRIDTLAKARLGLAKGNFDEAKTNYEAIFEDSKNDANSRMQALEYLCKKSVEKGDEGYLLGMVSKIEGDTAQEHHKKYILNTIQELNKAVAQPETQND